MALVALIRLKIYSKTRVKRPFLKRPKIGFKDRLSLNAGQKCCRMLQMEHSAIFSTFIKLPFFVSLRPLFCVFEVAVLYRFFCSMSRKFIAIITDHRPTQGTARKRHRTLTPTWQQEQSNQLSLPQRDDCKTRKDTELCTIKQLRTKHTKNLNNGIPMNNESTTTEPQQPRRPGGGGLKYIVQPKSLP